MRGCGVGFLDDDGDGDIGGSRGWCTEWSLGSLVVSQVVVSDEGLKVSRA